MKKLIFIFTLFSTSAIAQSSPEEIAASKELYTIYLSSDSSKIAESWKLDKNESIDFNKLVQMQADAYGILSIPTEVQEEDATSFNFEGQYIAIYNGVFSEDVHADFSIVTSKTKGEYLIEYIDVFSKSAQPNAFIDSLVSPYIDLILMKQLDSLMEMVYPKNYLDDVYSQIERIKSKRKQKKATASFNLMVEMVPWLIKEKLSTIAQDMDHSYTSNDLQLRLNMPILTVTHSFTTLDGEILGVTFSFQLRENNYQLVNIGSSGQTLPQKRD